MPLPEKLTPKQEKKITDLLQWIDDNAGDKPFSALIPKIRALGKDLGFNKSEMDDLERLIRMQLEEENTLIRKAARHITEAKADDRSAAKHFLYDLEDKIADFEDIDLVEIAGIVVGVLQYNVRKRGGDSTLLAQLNRLASEMGHLDAQITNRFFAKKK